MRKSIVYYHPRAVKEQPDRGSDLRVARMLNAFQQLDYEVILIAGEARIRHKKISELKSRISAGLKIEYVYAESTNAPIIFADKKMMPSNFFRDYAFFAWLKKQKIPFGAFYRDVYWRFDFFKQQLAWPFNILLKPLYYLDWYIYDKYSTKMFLPSETMNLHLPKKREEREFEALPPGFDTSTTPSPVVEVSSKPPLKLLYVGGVEPTVYNISALLEIIAGRNDLQLTICCRLPEWQKYGKIYQAYMTENIQLVHVNSEQLARYYHESDAFLMLMGYSEYMDFAMPVKLFESIGYAVPIVSLNQKEVAKYIQSHKIGWVIDKFDDLDELLSEIANNRSILSEKHNNLMLHRKDCSWDARARQVDQSLSISQDHATDVSQAEL